MKRAVLVIALTLLVANTASAFRPSVRWIFLRAADAQLSRKIQTLKIEQDATLYGMEGAPRGYRSTQTTYVRTPFQMREVLELPEGQRVELRTEERTRIDMPNAEGKSRKADADIFLHVGTAGPPADEERIADQAMADLGRYGVDTGVVSYARFEGRIAYVIGGRNWENDRSQVWVDKETFHILKVLVVVKVKGKNKSFETRYLGYGTADVGGWWPKTIERYEDGSLTARLVTTTIERNEPLDRELFAIER